jgi:hypothetical protein
MRRWEENIKMDLREVGFGGIDWIDLARDREKWRDFVNAVMNLRVPYTEGNLSSLGRVSFSERTLFHEVS